jgi:hypothetical protein
MTYSGTPGLPNATCIAAHSCGTLLVAILLGGGHVGAGDILGAVSGMTSPGSAGRAARLWGAAERVREQIGSSLPPGECLRYEQQVATARAALADAAAFDAAWREGRAMPLEQAVAYALEEGDG